MNKRLVRSLAIMGAVMALSGGAMAHHSFSMFDNGRELTLEGTVTKWQWLNPHAFLEMRVTDSTGKNVVWVLEGPSLAYLARKGWTKRSMNPGDKVTVKIAPLKDGSAGGLLQRAVVAGTPLPDFDPNPGLSEGARRGGGGPSPGPSVPTP